MTPARVAHALLAALILAAFTLQTVLVVRTPPGGSVGTGLLRLVSYFTIESNLLVALAAVLLVARPDRDGTVFRALRLTGLLGISITGIVYVTVLSGTPYPNAAAMACNIAFHYVAPPSAVLGWLVFGPRPRTSRADAARALVWPAAWVAWTFAHGAAAHWYPYPFTDVDVHGYPRVIVNVVAVGVVLAAFAALYCWLDRRLPVSRRPARPAAG